MRNSRGIEIKKGYHAWTERGIDGRVKSVQDEYAILDLENGRSEKIVHVDAISQVLPPMRVLKGGTVKANPVSSEIAGYPRRAWMGGTSLRDPKDLSSDARKAFQKVYKAYMDEQSFEYENYWKESPDSDTLEIFHNRAYGDAWAVIREAFPEEEKQRAFDPRYSNPTPRLTRYDQPSQRERINPRTGRPTKAASKRLKERRLKTHHVAPEGVWANPLTRVRLKSPSQRSKADPSPRLLKRRKVTAKAPDRFYANPISSLPYRVEYKTAKNFVPWQLLSAHSSKSEAVASANTAHKKAPSWIIRVWYDEDADSGNRDSDEESKRRGGAW